MENLTIIAAIGKNRELGYKNQLIWKIPEDLVFFHKMTLYKPVIMGLHTFHSLPKPLENRTSIILTHQWSIESQEEMLIFHALEEVLNFVDSCPKECMVMGGASIYRQFMPYTKQMWLTEIDGEYKADTYFPEFSKSEWQEVIAREYEYQDRSYRRVLYKRK